jgi:hypothetical protein
LNLATIECVVYSAPPEEHKCSLDVSQLVEIEDFKLSKGGNSNSHFFVVVLFGKQHKKLSIVHLRKTVCGCYSDLQKQSLVLVPNLVELKI